MQWHLRNFHSKSLKKSPPQKQLTTRINRLLPLLQIIGCSCPTILQQKTRKHCKTSNQSIENLLISSTYFSSTTSTLSNLLKHRQQSTFIKHIKTQQIQTCKTCKLETFQSLLQCIKRLAMLILSIPTTLDCLRHLSCSKQNHPKTLTIQSKFLFHRELSIPTSTKSYYLLKRFYSCWYKTRPQTHAQYQSKQTKELCIRTMLFTFFPRQYTEKKSSCLWQQQNCCKQPF